QEFLETRPYRTDRGGFLTRADALSFAQHWLRSEYMTAHESKYGIRPEFVYRKSDPETRRILGLKPTAIDDAIARGDIDPPAPLTATGKAMGWYGFQLIEMIERRLAAAPLRRAAPPPQRRKKKK